MRPHAPITTILIPLVALACSEASDGGDDEPGVSQGPIITCGADGYRACDYGCDSGLLHSGDGCYSPAQPTGPAWDDPKDIDRDWTNDLQGLTHDHDNWFMTNTDNIYKMAVQWKLTAEDYRSVWNPWYSGWQHLGDMAYKDGDIYIALEPSDGTESSPAIGIIDTDLSNPRVSRIPQESPQYSQDMPWVAYNPIDDLFYSSRFGNTYDSCSLYRYRVDPAGGEAEFVDAIPMHGAAGGQICINRAQGGAFADSGILYLLMDSKPGIKLNGQPFASGSGIQVFAIQLDAAYRVQGIQVNWDWEPDRSNGGNEELEGITIWDLDADGRSPPGIRGQIHLQMIRNSWTDDDDFYFKHFRLKDTVFLSTEYGERWKPPCWDSVGCRTALIIVTL